MVVLRDLAYETIHEIGDPIRRFRKAGQPRPHLFSPDLIRRAVDVFPIELLDIQTYHRVLHGQDVVKDIKVDREHVRLQCERELREKMLRLVEATIDANGNGRELQKLMTHSLPDFARAFRGFLFLCGGQVPRSDAEVLAKIAQLKLGGCRGFRARFHGYRRHSQKVCYLLPRAHPGSGRS
jgi:hypothetical protein